MASLANPSTNFDMREDSCVAPSVELVEQSQPVFSVDESRSGVQGSRLKVVQGPRSFKAQVQGHSRFKVKGCSRSEAEVGLLQDKLSSSEDVIVGGSQKFVSV